MTNHFKNHPTAEWIAAYYDGELHGDLLRQVENHLGQCNACRKEVESLGVLSSQLHTVPAADTAQARFIAQARFTAQVINQLPLAPETSLQYRFFRRLWQMVPIGLVTGWAFLQAVLWMTQLALIGFGGFRLDTGAMLQSILPAAGEFGGLFTGLVDPLIEVFIINLFLTGIIAVMFWGWLASWWAFKKKQGA